MHANHLVQYLDIYWAFDNMFSPLTFINSYLPLAYLKSNSNDKMGK